MMIVVIANIIAEVSKSTERCVMRDDRLSLVALVAAVAAAAVAAAAVVRRHHPIFSTAQSPSCDVIVANTRERLNYLDLTLQLLLLLAQLLRLLILLSFFRVPLPHPPFFLFFCCFCFTVTASTDISLWSNTTASAGRNEASRCAILYKCH